MLSSKGSYRLVIRDTIRNLGTIYDISQRKLLQSRLR